MFGSRLRSPFGARPIEYRPFGTSMMDVLESQIQNQSPNWELVNFWNTSLKYLTDSDRVLLLYRTQAQINNNDPNVYFSDLKHPDQLVGFYSVQSAYYAFVEMFSYKDAYWVLAYDPDRYDLRYKFSTVEPTDLGLRAGQRYISVRFSMDMNIDHILISPGFAESATRYLINICRAFNRSKREVEICNRVRDKFGETTYKIPFQPFLDQRLRFLHDEIGVGGPEGQFDEGSYSGEWQSFHSDDAHGFAIEYVKVPDEIRRPRQTSAKKQTSRNSKSAKTTKNKLQSTSSRSRGTKTTKKSTTRASLKPNTKKVTSVRSKAKKRTSNNKKK